jgi:hypothetical protein
LKKRTVSTIAVVALAAAIAGYLLVTPESEPPVVAPPATPAVAPPPAEPVVIPEAVVAPVIAHPLAAAPADEPLPAADQADAALQKALEQALGKRLWALVVPDELLRRIVASVDALPRKHLPASIVPLKRATGPLQVTRSDAGDLAIDPANAQRYGYLTRVVGVVDTRTLVGVYRHFYPLFQSAYEQLGYSGAYFNDRVVVAIDDLLAAPALDRPIALTQPKVLYEYADADLQARSAGQKIMLRIGRENASAIKDKLREIRALVAAAP